MALSVDYPHHTYTGSSRRTDTREWWKGMMFKTLLSRLGRQTSTKTLWWLVPCVPQGSKLPPPFPKLFFSHSHLHLRRRRKEVRLAKVIDHTASPTTHPLPQSTPPTLLHNFNLEQGIKQRGYAIRPLSHTCRKVTLIRRGRHNTRW
jgi:hypothetical protein